MNNYVSTHLAWLHSLNSEKPRWVASCLFQPSQSLCGRIGPAHRMHHLVVAVANFIFFFLRGGGRCFAS